MAVADVVHMLLFKCGVVMEEFIISGACGVITLPCAMETLVI